MSFDKLLKSIQLQLKKDREIFKETGCMSELLMRVEGFNRANKEH